MRKQGGITLMGAIGAMIGLAFIALFVAKLLPSYIEWYSVKKILASMEAQGDTKGFPHSTANAAYTRVS